MKRSVKGTPDIIWVDDQYWRLTPLIEPLMSDGYSYYGIETYSEAKSNFEKLQQSKLIILDIIIAPGDPKIDVLEHPYLGYELVMKDFIEMKVNRPIIVFTIVRESKILDDLESNTNVRGVFKKGESNQADFLKLASDILNSS